MDGSTGGSSPSIELLLAQQAAVMEQALTFNRALTKRFFEETKLQPRAADRRTDRRTDGRSRQSGGAPGLAEPLLACCYSQNDRDIVTVVPVDVKAQGPFVRNGEQPDKPRKPEKPTQKGLGVSWTASMKRKKRSDEMTHLFPKKSDVKNIVLGMLSKPRYSVEELYHDTGAWQAVARSNIFNNFSLLVIVLNTFWVAIDTDLNKAPVLCEAPALFQIIDNGFCTFFTLEMLVRFMAFRHKYQAFSDGWFVFDGFLVALMIWETWVLVFMYIVLGIKPESGGARNSQVLRCFRVFRLTRVARTARLLTSVPELMILAKGMVIAMRSVVAVLCLLGLVIYVFGIIFVELFSGQDDRLKGKFDTVPQSMNFLLTQVLTGFDADFLANICDVGLPYYFMFILYYILASLTIMNMLIGILCDVVATVAEAENEDALMKKMEKKIEQIAEAVASGRRDDGRLTISQDDFHKIVEYPEMTLELNDLGVDVIGLMDFASFVFQECEELSYDDFLHMAHQFRRAKSATVTDVMDIRRQVAMQANGPHMIG